jgi:hypothetical protein
MTLLKLSLSTRVHFATFPVVRTILDPKRDAAGSAEQDALDALNKEELAGGPERCSGRTGVQSSTYPAETPSETPGFRRQEYQVAVHFGDSSQEP